MKRKIENPRILRIEEYEDENYRYVVEYWTNGKNVNMHPKHPEKSKDEISKEVSRKICDALGELMERRQAELAKAEG